MRKIHALFQPFLAKNTHGYCADDFRFTALHSPDEGDLHPLVGLQAGREHAPLQQLAVELAGFARKHIVAPLTRNLAGTRACPARSTRWC
jgi:hypothetical protein